jgi:hypothetical protein
LDYELAGVPCGPVAGADSRVRVATSLALGHPGGGPRLALRLDPERARAAAGFDYFAIGVPDKEAIDRLAAWLSAQGEEHAGVHWAQHRLDPAHAARPGRPRGPLLHAGAPHRTRAGSGHHHP